LPPHDKPRNIMIDTGDVTWTGKKGDVVCRPSDWKAVLKFFLVNYGLHALTVVTEPGSGVVNTVSACVMSILLPYWRLMTALWYLVDFPITGKSSLEQAKLAGALVMVVPKTGCAQ
ncbi:hypothetical protein DFP73DRAFT_474084, partial [Morchella snyderi]